MRAPHLASSRTGDCRRPQARLQKTGTPPLVSLQSCAAKRAGSTEPFRTTC
ncbi:hypothetical protein [Actinacidiphila sp. bgisy167]|uniref:hypothetical protein n=1 Tax=Actinacidiphila sp. bgisy167 TaxID=3413797 RepID=UPI003D72BD6A